MATTPWRLDYLSSAAPALTDRIDPDFCARYGCDGDVRCTALISDDGLVLERAGMQRVVRDFRGRKHLFVDLRRKEYLLAGAPAIDSVTMQAVLSGPVARRPVRIGSESRELQRFDLLDDRLPVEIWVWPWSSGNAQAVRALWDSLVPGAGEKLAAIGLPADIIVRDPDKPGEVLARLQLMDIARTRPQALPVTPPRGYRAMAGANQGMPTSSPPRPGRRQVVNDILRNSTVSSRLSALASSTRSGTSPDVAWISDQRVLDVLREIVNGVAAGLDGFTAEGRQQPTSGGVIGNAAPDPVTLHLDWWQQLEPHIRFGPNGDDTGETLRCARRVLLALHAASGSPVSGLSAADQVNYDRSISLNPGDNPFAVLGAETGRVLNVFSGAWLNDAAVDRIAQARFDEIAVPRDIDLPFSEIRTILPGNVVEVRAYNFRLSLAIDGQPVIDQMTWEDGHLRAVFTVPSLSVTFRFSTRLADTSEALHCAIWTFGVCALISTNDGDGSLVANNPRIAIGISPRQHYDNTTRLTATLDRDASALNYVINLVGWNPVQDIALAVFTALDTGFLQTLEGHVFDPLARNLSGLLDGIEAFHWPTGLWHADDGPPVGGQPASFVAGSARWAAGLVNRYGLWPAIGGGFDASVANPAAFVLSRPYLTAWLRERIGPVAGEVRTGRDFANVLGVALEDPRALDPDRDRLPRDPFAGGPLFDDGADFATRLAGLVENCEPPPSLPAQHAYRGILHRRAPEIVFAGNGTSDRSGTFEMRYSFAFGAVRYDLVHVPMVIPHETCVDLRQPVPGGPIESGRPVGRPNMRAMANQMVSHRAIPEGMTPGLLARQEEAILRARDRFADPAGFTPDPGRPGDVVIPPGRPGPGRPPRPEPGGFTPLPPRPELPQVVCEPPHCEWTSFTSEGVVQEMVRANVVVRGPLLTGFGLDLDAAPWLPTLRLGRPVEPLEASFDGTVDLAGPFATIDRRLVETRILEMCRNDAMTLAAPLGQFVPAPFDAGDLTAATRPFSMTRPLIPPLPIQVVFGDQASFQRVNDHLTGLASFRQPGGGTDPAYVVSGEFLGWPIEIDQHITDIIVR